MFIIIEFSKSLYFIARMLSFDWLNLAIFHMVENCNFVLYEINWEFSDLFVWRLFLIFFEFLRDFKNQYFANMMIKILIILIRR